MTTTLLVPLEGSSNITAALPVAWGLARLMKATVVLIHVGQEPLTPCQLLDRMGLPADDLRGLVIDQSTGSLADAIVREAAARHSALIVVGSQGADDPSDPIGGVIGDVLRRAPCPVVLVPSGRGRRPWALHQLVLPHDGTPTSAAAIAPAADFAARAGADLIVLHVATPGGERPVEPGAYLAPRYLDQPQHEWPMWQREFLGRVCCLGPVASTAKIRLVLAQGEAAAAILEFARRNGSDLIALAWRGGFGPERAQTMRRVIRDAGCPVIIFRVKAS
jgi:nucleotide-binding universal stress UspA family protein